MLIDQTNYDTEKMKIAASADIPIADLVVGGNASFDQFKQNLQTYFQSNHIFMNNQEAVSIVTQTVDDNARKDFVDCMQKASGLRVWFTNETSADATVYLAFTGAPGAGPLKYQVQLIGGTPTNAAVTKGIQTLANGGETSFLLARDHPQGEIHISVSGQGYASDAVSLIAPPPPPPVVVPPPPAAHNLAPAAVVQTNPVGTGSPANGGSWNATASPLTSVTFTWPNAITVTQITLGIAQTPNGPTHHQVFGIHTDGTQVLIADLNGQTSNGQTLLLNDQPPAGGIASIRIDSLSSPSWIAWQNIQIFGY